MYCCLAEILIELDILYFIWRPRTDIPTNKACHTALTASSHLQRMKTGESALSLEVRLVLIAGGHGKACGVLHQVLLAWRGVYGELSCAVLRSTQVHDCTGVFNLGLRPQLARASLGREHLPQAHPTHPPSGVCVSAPSTGSLPRRSQVPCVPSVWQAFFCVLFVDLLFSHHLYKYLFIICLFPPRAGTVPVLLSVAQCLAH